MVSLLKWGLDFSPVRRFSDLVLHPFLQIRSETYRSKLRTAGIRMHRGAIPRRYLKFGFFEEDERFQSLSASSSLSLSHAVSLAVSCAPRVGSKMHRSRASTCQQQRSLTKQPPKEGRAMREEEKEKNEKKENETTLFFCPRRKEAEDERERKEAACGCRARSPRAWARAAPGSRCARSVPRTRVLRMVRSCA